MKAILIKFDEENTKPSTVLEVLEEIKKAHHTVSYDIVEIDEEDENILRLRDNTQK